MGRGEGDNMGRGEGDAAHTLTQEGVDEAFFNSAVRTKSTSVFKYAKSNQGETNSNSVSNYNSEDSGLSSRDSRTSSPVSSPRSSNNRRDNTSPLTSRSGSTHELTSSSSSIRDCSKFSIDSDQMHTDIDPAFIFRQLYPLISSSSELVPVLLPDSEDVSRSLRNLDLLLVANTHKIGLIYVGAGQTSEVTILRNRYGSDH